MKYSHFAISVTYGLSEAGLAAFFKIGVFQKMKYLHFAKASVFQAVVLSPYTCVMPRPPYKKARCRGTPCICGVGAS